MRSLQYQGDLTEAVDVVEEMVHERRRELQATLTQVREYKICVCLHVCVCVCSIIPPTISTTHTAIN